MKLKKIIISFFLLFVYSISFAHSLTYHEHGFYTEHQYEFIDVINEAHSHAHHSHSEKNSADKAHINHNNHCDEGVIDLITCVLSDLTNHHHDDCTFVHQKHNETKRLTNQSTKSKVLLSFGVCSHHFDTDFIELVSYKNQINANLQGPFLDDIPLRGPPINC